MYDPYAHAAELGIEVIHKPIQAAHEMWFPDWNIIIIRTGMRQIHDRCALAHGVAHATLGHRDDRPKHEHAADRVAAGNLIDPRELRSLVRWTDDTHIIAAELGVTTRMVRMALHMNGMAPRHDEEAPAA
jgi:Zn-dependent peptidase ImmA (M78 family)